MSKVVVDVDPGVDDAEALLMVLSQNHNILALTISQGNTLLSNATHNALRVLRLCDRLDIPVYKGDMYTLDHQVTSTGTYFGLNGFGDVADDTFDYSSFLSHPETASEALVCLVHTHPHQVTLIALASETNIARAMQAEAGFGGLLKDCFIMGGNYMGVGNKSAKAEFNFLADPKAADLVVRTLDTSITIITWELCLNHPVPLTWYDSLVSKGTPKADFLKQIGQLGRERARSNNETSHLFADQIAVAVFLDDSIILESQQIQARVETSDGPNLGEMVVEWDSTSPRKNIRLVTKVDIEKVKNLLVQSV